MASLNDILSIGRSGVLTHQARLAVISHNIANVNTSGYHRQLAVLGENPPNQPNLYTTRPYDFGTGVRLIDIVRAYDEAKEAALTDQNSSTSAHSTMASALPDVEALLLVSGDSSLSDALSAFWSAWQDVATNPDNLTMRSVLLERSGTLSYAFQSITKSLSGYRDLIVAGAGPYTGVIPTTVADINDIASRIQDLNVKITRDTAMGVNANDLLDERDSLIQELSQQVGITVAVDKTITIDGQVLVSGDGVTRNDLEVTSGTPPSYSIAGNPVNITSGALYGWNRVVGVVDSALTSLDTMANELIGQVNAIHVAGYDLNGNAGVDFFSGAGASGIQVNSALYDAVNPMLSHPEMIAAATTLHDPGPPPDPNTGDGSNALAIADLATLSSAALGNRTFDAYFTDLVTSVGDIAYTESILAEDGQTALNALQNAIQEQSGVNLDEEMMELLAARRAYEASARVVRTVDEILDTIINRMA